MGNLYLGILDHWKIDPASGVPWSETSNFGAQTLKSYASMTQTVLKIRAARTYPGSTLPDEGKAPNFAWYRMAQPPDYRVYDPNPANWRFVFQQNVSGQLLGMSDPSTDSVVQSWYAAAVASVTSELANMPIQSNRWILIDDETMHLWEWGRRGQGGNGHLKHQTLELMQTHEAIYGPIKMGLLDALRAAFPTDSFAFYNIPFSKNKQPPYDADWWLPSDNPPDLAGQIDQLVRPLLLHSDFVDGHLYLNSKGLPPMQNAERRKGWMRGQIRRKKAVSDSLGKPIIFRYWLFDSPTKVHDDPGASGEPESLFIREFFEVCAEEGVEHASVDTGRATFDLFAFQAGVSRGQLWRDYIVRAAQEAGYIEDVGGGHGSEDPVTILFVEPASIPRGLESKVVIGGSGFGQSSIVTLEPTVPFVVDSVLPDRIDLTIVPPSSATPGGLSISVTTPGRLGEPTATIAITGESTPEPDPLDVIDVDPPELPVAGVGGTIVVTVFTPGLSGGPITVVPLVGTASEPVLTADGLSVVFVLTLPGGLDAGTVVPITIARGGEFPDQFMFTMTVTQEPLRLPDQLPPSGVGCGSIWGRGVWAASVWGSLWIDGVLDPFVSGCVYTVAVLDCPPPAQVRWFSLGSGRAFDGELVFGRVRAFDLPMGPSDPGAGGVLIPSGPADPFDPGGSGGGGGGGAPSDPGGGGGGLPRDDAEDPGSSTTYNFF